MLPPPAIRSHPLKELDSFAYLQGKRSMTQNHPQAGCFFQDPCSCEKEHHPLPAAPLLTTFSYFKAKWKESKSSCFYPVSVTIFLAVSVAGAGKGESSLCPGSVSSIVSIEGNAVGWGVFIQMGERGRGKSGSWSVLCSQSWLPQSWSPEPGHLTVHLTSEIARSLAMGQSLRSPLPHGRGVLTETI